MKKPINFSEHAELRINFRNIDREIIIQVVNNPGQKFQDNDNNIRDICQSLIYDENGKQKLLRTVIEETNDEILIISAYITSKIKKYWRE